MGYKSYISKKDSRRFLKLPSDHDVSLISQQIDTHFTTRLFHAEKDWCTGRTKSFQDHLHFSHSILHQLDDLRNISVCEMSLRTPLNNEPDVSRSSLASKNSTNFPNNSSQQSFIWPSALPHMPDWNTKELHIWFSKYNSPRIWRLIAADRWW